MPLQRGRTSSPFKRDLTPPRDCCCSDSRRPPASYGRCDTPVMSDMKLLRRAESTARLDCRRACPGHYIRQRLLLTQIQGKL